MLDMGYYHMDCMDGMKEFPDNYFELALVDPIYGDIKPGGYLTGETKKGSGPATEYDRSAWQQPKTTKEYFNELFRVSKNQIIFGGNYFMEEIGKNSSCWIVWDKCNGNSYFADAELAWTSFSGATRLFRFMWNGMNQGKSITEGHIMQGNKKKNETRIHPMQKPVALYTWILQNFAQEGDKILDTHTGSASSIIACENLGFEYVAFEKEQTYYTSSLKRIKDNRAQISLFDLGIQRIV